MIKPTKLLSIILTIALVFASLSYANFSEVSAKGVVKSVKVKKVKKKLTLRVGDKKTYKVKVKAKKGKTGFTAKSSNKKVVSVKKKGKKVTLTALKVGKAKVTIRSKKDKKKKCVIKVVVKSKKAVEPTTKPDETTTAAEETTKAPVVTTKAPVETTVPVTKTPGETTTAQVESTTNENPTGVEPTTEPSPTVETTTENETSKKTGHYSIRKKEGDKISVYIVLDDEIEEPQIASTENIPDGITCSIQKTKNGNSALYFGGVAATKGEYEIKVIIKGKDGLEYVYDATIEIVERSGMIVEETIEGFIEADEDITGLFDNP